MEIAERAEAATHQPACMSQKKKNSCCLTVIEKVDRDQAARTKCNTIRN